MGLLLENDDDDPLIHWWINQTANNNPKHQEIQETCECGPCDPTNTSASALQHGYFFRKPSGGSDIQMNPKNPAVNLQSPAVRNICILEYMHIYIHIQCVYIYIYIHNSI